MKKTKWIRIFKKLHRWPAVIIAFIATLFAVSGIVMNHRNTFSSIDISRKLLPKNYAYNNWNLAAVRSSLPFQDGNLVYGNIGIWKTDEGFDYFEDFNLGFPKGIDNRKIYAVKNLNDKLFAGTHLGLYSRKIENGQWKQIVLDDENQRISDLTLKDDTLLVLTRNYLFKSTNGVTFQKVQLPAPIGYEHKTGLFDTFWQLHSGELFGLAGKLIVDLLGIVTILLSATGVLHFFFPGIIKRRKKKDKVVIGYISVKKQNLHWHNVLGYIFAIFLIINTFAGIHLRPPLLIAIATKQVGIIPGTHLDQPNPWFDKLRRVAWDDIQNRYLFSTSEGFFWADKQFKHSPEPALSQPPVSVMGCNVLEQMDDHRFLVGSFSGLFVWDTQSGMVADYFTGKPYQAPSGMARPIGNQMVAGMIVDKNKAWWFDYNQGVVPLTGITFPDMPKNVRKASPMSLWNVSQEIHTGRIFENILGPFYILIVPLAGICLLMVLITGFFVWWWVYRKNKKQA
ncbi:MAG TPA: PepSY-associated TM helix domain-containing protein [Draconibacterium sp.]|nr:PepSY-associated TM helix domain-containing protein [Draconibacterium sp.]